MFEVGAQCLPSEPFCTHAAGKARESAGSGKGCARMGTSIPDWQRAACPQLLRELHRADQRGPLCSCSFSSQMLSICTNICTFCQSDSIITTYSIFELLEYFLHYFMLRWGNVFGWTMRLLIHMGSAAPLLSKGVPRLLRKLFDT